MGNEKKQVFIRQPYSSQEEWLKLRKLGGSDASAVLGLNPDRTNLEHWQEEMGVKEKPKIDNMFTRYGTLAEKPLRYLIGLHFYDFENMKPLIKVKHTEEVLSRIDKPFMTASLDGELEVMEDFTFNSYWKEWHFKNHFEEQPKPIELKKGMKGILEVKTTNIMSSMHKEKWTSSIPINYYIQCLHYLNVTNYDFVILVAELKFSDTYERRYYGFLKNDKLDDLKMVEDGITYFYNENIVKNIEPPLKINL